jgi:uncharacterized HAD superfamily protein
MKLRIAFDLDGVLIDMASVVKKLILEIHGIEMKKFPKEQDQFDWGPATGLPSKELWRIYRLAYKEIKSTPFYPGGTELLAKLYEATGEPPFILTARPFDAANETYEIVKRMAKKTPFNLVLKHPRASKEQYLHGYNFFVEDRRKTALELSAAGICVLLIERNYNYIKNVPDNIIYIKGVEQLINHVDRFVNNYK